MIAAFGAIKRILWHNEVEWQQASRGGEGMPEWTLNYVTGKAIPIPGPDWSIAIFQVGDVVPLYLHDGETYYGPPCGKLPR
jgi:hypothetical protein